MRFSVVFIRVVFVVLYAWLSSAVYAVTDSLPDSRGKDFWFCFPPNFHNDGIDEPEVQKRDSLYVFVASEKPTNVTIEYRDSVGTLFSKRFRISDPKQMLSFGEKFYPFELVGFNRCGDRPDLSAGQNLRIANQYFHVTSDEDVTVYAMSQALTTSDAFLVLPTDALGNQYYVMSYPADPANNAASATPSQFAIVATEDSTEVRIATDEPIYRYGRVPSVIRLNKGDVYLVQSQVGDNSRRVDLTGTYVESTRPIALFSGHQRATIPIEDDRRSSRDCLIEQMTPISTWGRGALLVPYPEPSDAVVFSGDRFRILAAYDSTEVYIDSVYITTLDAGQFYEGELRAPHAVLATRAVMVAQFKHTSSLTSTGGGTTNMLGDPFMMMIPPSNQFLSSYRFVNVQAIKQNNFGEDVITYEEQWLSIVLPNSAKSSLKVDGVTPIVTFRPIPKSTYSYVQMRMTDGVHTVEADTGIGIYVYGYGIANSYGYVGGMAYKRYDFNAPRLFGATQCYRYQGFVYDTALADTKVAKVVLMRDSVDNMNVAIESFIPPADSVRINATLVDELRDGFFKVESRDIEGFVSRQRVDVPGYTLRIMDTSGAISVTRQYQFAAGLRRTYCDEYFFINTGKFVQTVADVRMASPTSLYSLQVPSLPIRVNPGDTIPFTLCYRFDNEGDYADTLLVDMGCGARPLVISTVVAGEDTSIPRITYTDNACRSERIILVREDTRFQTGIKNIIVKDSTNCSFSSAFDAVRTNLTAKVSDADYDAWYTLVVIDSMGNSSVLTDTIEGFTLRYAGVDGVGYKNLRAAAFIGETIDSISIENYGAFKKTVQNLPLRQNQIFSIPQHQLPFTLLPGETKRIQIYYNVREYPPSPDSTWSDTLELSFGCFTKNLRFTAGVVPTDVEGDTRCDVGIVSLPVSSGLISVWGPYPNPAVSGVRCMIAGSAATNVEMKLIDSQGNVVRSSTLALDNKTPVSIEFDLQDLTVGWYVAEFSSEHGRVFLPLMIVR